MRYIPGFAYVLALYVAGTFLFPDHRATLVEWRGYTISWTEALLVVAALVAMVDLLRVSQPGIDNTVEAIMMAAMAGIQALLFALAAAGVPSLGVFNTAELLLLTLVALTQAVVAILINARSLRRSIDIADSP
ncbi:MAG: hypothetical protein WAN86_08875 [Hyphomicrobiaceae bacterium]